MSKKTGVKRHVHKYEFLNGYWCCANCTHLMPRNYRNGSILGLESVCWGCESEFIIEAANLGQVKPKCFDCDMNNPIRSITQILTHNRG